MASPLFAHAGFVRPQYLILQIRNTARVSAAQWLADAPLSCAEWRDACFARVTSALDLRPTATAAYRAMFDQSYAACLADAIASASRPVAEVRSHE
ncbi:hypothetical protein FCJ61_25350 [Burkholderia metallica]|uniref:hypothetical protein n=1 Tax=Burkholderia metallica TaxID=488729 RepID=UPI00157B5D36|nr:hypothetical protein [Burkholderia metallica]NTZ86239.1 hypothetical protein [Burkholderia metallica]